jgi:hypothetical protein
VIEYIHNKGDIIMKKVFWFLMGFLIAVTLYTAILNQPVVVNRIDCNYYQPLTLNGSYTITELEFPTFK